MAAARKNKPTGLLEDNSLVNRVRGGQLWKQKCVIALICIAGLLVMSVINVFQQSFEMLVTTSVSALVAAVFLLVSVRRKNTYLLEVSLILIFGVLFTVYTLIGGNDGFAILWIVLVPIVSTLIIDLKLGMALSLYFLIFLFLVFDGPLHGLLRFSYSPMMESRFPFLYLIDCAFSFFIAAEMIRARADLIRAQAREKKAGHHDVVTGLENRTAYMEYQEKFDSSTCEMLGVVFVDVNGLHELNNVEGHEKGDELLRTVSQDCVEAFEDGKAYRLGGDEFLIVCPNVSSQQLASRMEDLNALVNRQGYSISYGICHEENGPFNLAVMMKTADEIMLANKAAYYRQEGNDRRSRR